MDIIIFILFGGMVLFYILYFSFRKKIKVNDSVFYYANKIHFFTVGLIIFNIILHFYDINFRGNWTIKVIMWVFLISSFIIQFKTDSLKSAYIKFYFKILFFSPTVLVISWLIPMFGAFVCYSFMLFFNTYDNTIIYNDKNYKLSFEEGFLKYDYEFEVYRKNWIFEHKIKSVLLNEMNFDKIVKVNEENNCLRIKFLENAKMKDTLIRIGSNQKL